MDLSGNALYLFQFPLKIDFGHKILDKPEICLVAETEESCLSQPCAAALLHPFTSVTLPK